jgi:peptidoglycan hydrolase-like protein with peptidoglycan-binding domain
MHRRRRGELPSPDREEIGRDRPRGQVPMRRRLVLVPLLVAAALPGSAAAYTNPQIPGLQVALRAHGYDVGPIDGVVGRRTAGAVRAFQRREGIHADGLAGPRTRAQLGRLGRPLFGVRTLARGRIGWDVSVLQFLLAHRGFAPPHLNGNFGRGTERAVRRFQRAFGLAVDGIAGRATQRALLTGHRHRRARAAARTRTPTRTHLVRTGDTLTALAARYGTTIAALERANHLRPGAFLLIGTRLRIPAGARHVAGTASAVSDVRGSLDRWAVHYGVDPHLARALAWMESGFQPTIRSPIGAWGVMQVTPATWDYAESVLIGMPIPRTADGNVRIGLAYLHHLLHYFGGDERLALAAYYQGPASVRKRGLLRVTKAFVADVQALKQRM